MGTMQDLINTNQGLIDTNFKLISINKKFVEINDSLIASFRVAKDLAETAEAKLAAVRDVANDGEQKCCGDEFSCADCAEIDKDECYVTRLRAILDPEKEAQKMQMPPCDFEGYGKPSVHVAMSLKNGVWARCKEHDQGKKP